MKMNLLRPLCLLFTSISMLMGGCSSAVDQQPENVILKDAYKDYFTIGAAYNTGLFKTSLNHHFNSLTAENDMKWLALEANEGQFDFSNADKYISFAKENNMGVRGHALVWHEAMPDLAFEGKNKEQVIEMEKNHVSTVVTHFKDDVYCWDVCNEVIDDSPTELNEEKSNVYRESKWYTICGKDFIKEAYLEAYRTLESLGLVGKVKLYYNDYDNDKPNKKAKTIEMIKWLKEENVPIDGIGLQCHYHLGSFDPAILEQAIIDYSNLGLDVQITEFDVDIYDETQKEIPNYEHYDDVPMEVLQTQATIYDRAFEIFRRNKDKISNVTFWGVYDAVTYMNDNDRYGYRTNYPYVFDVMEEEKPAFYRITDFDKYKGNYPYSYYSERTSEQLNVYEGGKDRFDLTNFYPTDEDCLKFDPSTNTCEYYMYKSYQYLYTTVKGPIADFFYINIKAKGIPGNSLALRLYYGEKEDENHNILGKDISFALEGDYVIHSLKVRGVLQTRLDILEKIAIYPEIGQSGVTVTGEFTFSDIWFSKTLPEGARWENKGVDSGETIVTVNGWTTDNWTGYILYNMGNNQTGVRYSKPDDWATVERYIDIGEEDNGLFFKFKNKKISNKPSITCMHIKLRGDVSEHVPAGSIVDGKVVEYDYDLYYESEIYFYDMTKEDEVPIDEEGNVTLELSMLKAIKEIGSHHESGYRLTLLIESVPDDVTKYHRARTGDMVILDCHLYHGEFVEDLYSQYGGNSYKFTKKEGVDMNITYENLKGDSWAKIAREVKDANHDSTITLKIRNNGDNKVRFTIHAGIYADDERSDAKNQLFYPLWSTSDPLKNDDGYFTDGQSFDIAKDEIQEITISVDSEYAKEDDAIDCIQFLFDSCRNDSQNTYNGNIDIVSLEVA